MAKLYRALDGRIDAHSQLKYLLRGLVWEPWGCLLISSFIIAVNCGDRGRANQADRDGKKKSGIKEHDVVTDSRSGNGK